MVEHKDAARTAPVRRAQSADIDSFGPAMYSVQPGIACAAKDFLRLDHLDDFRLAGIWLRIENVDARRTQPRHNQIAPLDVRVGRIGAQRRAACLPATVV